jgi:hypothetical protein
MSRDLGDNFSQVFELIPALDDVSLDQVYRIRHDVYCRDLGWEPVREDGRESDEYDRHSFHCLLRRRDNGVAVGCTRLILARPEDPAFPLPFEISCRDVLDKSIADPAKVPRHTIGEVRALPSPARSGSARGEACAAVSMTEADFEGRSAQARFRSFPVLGPLPSRGAWHRACLRADRAAAGQPLRTHHDIRAVGAIDHRGTCAVAAQFEQVVAGLRPIIRPLYEVIAQSVASAFQAQPDAAARITRRAG